MLTTVSWKIRIFFTILVVAVSLALTLGVAGATPLDFTGDLAPDVTGDDVLGTAFNFIAAFSVLVLAGMGMKFAPRIVRGMKRMM